MAKTAKEVKLPHNVAIKLQAVYDSLKLSLIHI